MSNWALVGGDPSPGNPDQIRLRVGHLDRSAEALRTVSVELSKISRGTEEAAWKGAAADSMRTVIDGFRLDLHPIAGSFEKVSRLMASYATNLADLQARASQAVRRAELVEARRVQGVASRQSAAELLDRQRRAVTASRKNERGHAARTVLSGLHPDPSVGAAAEAERARLERERQRAETAGREAEAAVRRHEATLRTIAAEMATERKTISTIGDEWERISKTTAKAVDESLPGQLRNRSDLQKELDRVKGEALDIWRFVKDPMDNLDVLRTWLGRISTLLQGISIVLDVIILILAATGVGVLPAGFVAALKMAIGVNALVVAWLMYALTAYMADTGKKGVTNDDAESALVDAGFSIFGVIPGGTAAGAGLRKAWFEFLRSRGQDAIQSGVSGYVGLPQGGAPAASSGAPAENVCRATIPDTFLESAGPMALAGSGGGRR